MDSDLRALLEVAALCNDARLVEREGAWQVIGDPTEGALVVAAAKAGHWQEALEQAMPRRAEAPFDSDRKRMSTLHGRDGKVRVCVKGAPDLLLPHCTHWRRGGQVVPHVAADERLVRGDRLLIIGPPASVRRVASLA